MTESTNTLSAKKQRLLELRLNEKRAGLEVRTIPRRKGTDAAPLSFGQERLWFLDQLEPGSAVYNIPMELRFAGALNVPMLQRCLNEVLRRHEPLRTGFKAVEGQPVQVVQTMASLEVPLVDLSDQPEPRREAEATRLCLEEARRPFDLCHDLTLRARLFRLGETDHILCLTMHHIASDGWSVGLLVRELSTLYEAFVEGKPSPLPELVIQYADFALWQRQWLQGEILGKQLGYWRKQLEEAPTLLELPTDHPRPAVQSYRGALMPWQLPKPLLVALGELSRREGVTLFMTLLAGFQTLLHRYTSSDEILVGSPIAGRNQVEIEPLIGFFINTLVLRGDLSGNPTFRTLLSRTRQTVLGAYAHQDLPFERLVEELHPERDMSRSPFFQVMFVLQNAPWEPAAWADLEVTPMPIDSGTSKLDLTLFVRERGGVFHAAVEYNTDLFEAATIRRLLGHYQTLLEGIVANPDQRLSDLPLLTSAERQQIVVGWNQTEVGYPRHRCLHELIEEQVERTPESVAVVFEDKQLTYRQLNERANQLARHLQGLGVGPDTLVGICVERSLEMVVGLLGILKAGGAYVPLDPEYPKQRLAFMLEDARPVALVTQRKLRNVLPSHQVRVVYTDPSDETSAEIKHESRAELKSRSNCLAYVLFTSGSTGRPKGVAIEHRSAVALAMWAKQVFTAEEFAGVLFSTSICFDLSIFELFVTLGNGGKVILAKEVLELPTLRAARDVRMINTVPSAIAELMRGGGLPASVITVNLAGEPLAQSLVDQLYERHSIRRVFDLYGPTETTTYSAFTLRERGGKATIGRPIANTQIYILDRYLRPVPIGVPGELHIGGIGLARGYHNRPELTVEKFIPDPFRSEPGARLYKTGDLARYLPNGAIEYLGRMDHQVKIRGFRIELGEIESVLRQHAAVREAVVVAREEEAREKRLVAYVVAKRAVEPSVSELRGFLKEKLPDYMVPSAFVTLDRLPLTPNGKVDRKALPAPEQKKIAIEPGYVAPATYSEQVLCRIWREQLNLERVGTKDNFFDLGGYSLLAVRVVGEINKTLKVRLDIPTFFKNPTIERLATVIDQGYHTRPEPRLIPLQPGRTGLPLFFIGASLAEHRIAQLIGEERPIFALDVPIPTEWAHAINARDRGAMPTIEQLGELYGNALSACAGSSPCVVVGCNWGMLALEAARVLQHSGGNLAFVLLIDAFTWSGLTRGTAWQSWLWICRAVTSTADDTRYIDRLSEFLRNSWRLLRWLRKRMPGVVKRRLVRSTSPSRMPSRMLDEEGVPFTQAVMNRFSRIAAKSFHPRPLDASGVLIRAELPNEEMLPGIDFSNGWRDLFAPGLEIVQAKGDHVSMVADENAASLRRQINEVLDRHSLSQEKRREGRD